MKTLAYLRRLLDAIFGTGEYGHSFYGRVKPEPLRDPDTWDRHSGTKVKTLNMV